MKIYDLRRYSHPDLSNHLIHFVGRTGKANDRVPEDITELTAPGRLANILEEEAIRAFPVFFGGDDPVVCFTECTPAGVRTLIRERRYSPWGVAFTKDLIFKRGGGPAFYVRGDEWKHVENGFPPELRARCTKLWPGADFEPGLETIFADARLGTPSEWTHEREWRVFGDGDQPAFRFRTEDIAFVVVGMPIEEPSHVPTVLINEATGRIQDDAHVWLTDTDAKSSTAAETA
jgi:hypothetical protein